MFYSVSMVNSLHCTAVYTLITDGQRTNTHSSDESQPKMHRSSAGHFR